MAKKYYWLKLKNDFFSQPRIKKLRKIAGGDTYTIIYLKMQLLSLKDDGKLFFEGIEDEFAKEVALTIDEDIDNVTVTIQFLLAQGLMKEISEDEFLMTETTTLIGSETDAAVRKRISRKNQKEQLGACNDNLIATKCDNVTAMSQAVTSCHTEIEIEKEKEKDIDKTLPTCPASQGKQDDAIYKLILNTGDYFSIDSEYLANLQEWYPAVDVDVEIRKMQGWLDSHARNRKTKNGIKRFITGWLGKAQNSARSQPAVQRKSGFNQIQNRTYDMAALESQLLKH